LYTRYGWVDQDIVLELWGGAVVHIAPAVETYLAVRTAAKGWTDDDPLWPNLQYLLVVAKQSRLEAPRAS
jgi:hypothetical protein